jgi:N12 class adenine-specific DNA methylase
MIPLSLGSVLENLKEQKSRVDELIENAGKATGALKKEKERLTKAIGAVLAAEALQEYQVCFDELGIERLFVYEAHNYKNVEVPTKIMCVHGISKSGSEKCNAMMEKVHFVQKKNGGRGVVLATGTPITNSITDIFVMQQYLQSGELALLDLQSFDSWIGMFAERKTEFEIDVDTSNYRMVTRFSEFHNLPELTSLLSSIADFHPAVGSGGLPTCNGYQDMLIGKTTEFTEYLKQISKRADAVRQGHVSRREDNMLKITTDGRKAALDMRLVDETASYNWQSKVARCGKRVRYLF